MITFERILTLLFVLIFTDQRCCNCKLKIGLKEHRALKVNSTLYRFLHLPVMYFETNMTIIIMLNQTAVMNDSHTVIFGLCNP
jgi:hypothetical protein